MSFVICLETQSMKTILLFLFGLGIMNSFTFGQETKTVQKNSETIPLEMKNDHFGEGLNLSEDQKAKIEEVKKSAREERQKVLYDETMDEVESKIKIERLNKIENDNLWEILTPEQMKKHKELEKNLPHADAARLPS